MGRPKESGVAVMDFIEGFIQFIKELGFPIACVVALFWQNTRLNDAHKEEMAKITDALNNNTMALIELKEKIGGIQK